MIKSQRNERADSSQQLSAETTIAQPNGGTIKSGVLDNNHSNFWVCCAWKQGSVQTRQNCLR